MRIALLFLLGFVFAWLPARAEKVRVSFADYPPAREGWGEGYATVIVRGGLPSLVRRASDAPPIYRFVFVPSQGCAVSIDIESRGRAMWITWQQYAGVAGYWIGKPVQIRTRLFSLTEEKRFRSLWGACRWQGVPPYIERKVLDGDLCIFESNVGGHYTHITRDTPKAFKEDAAYAVLAGWLSDRFALVGTVEVWDGTGVGTADGHGILVK